MEKSHSTTDGSISEEPMRTYSAHRKPIPPPTKSYQQSRISSKEFRPEDQIYRSHLHSTHDNHHRRHRRHHHHRSHGPQRPQTLFSQLQARWQGLSWCARAGLIAGVICLVTLIIGLSVGLAAHHSRITNLPLPSNHGGPYDGDLTYYDPGLGACGWTNSGSDAICAVSHIIFDAVSTGSNPNENPLCGKKIRARREGKSIDLTVVDRCTGCKATDIDTTRSVFGQLAQIDQGRVNVSWSWLEDVPDAAATG